MKGLQRLLLIKKWDKTLAEVLASINEPLQRVEELIRKAAQSSVQEMTEMALHLLSAGGKRLRPALTLLCAQLFGEINQRTIAFAAVVELMHTASLIHDDVIDKAELMRGKATVHILWGNEAAIMCGDFLYATAFNILAKDGDIEVIRTMANASSQICEGEVLELQLAFNPFVTKAQCLEIARMKTAELMAAACKIGAMSTKADRQVVEALESFGRNLGVAFQIVDDALDWEGSVDEIGKPVGSDLLEGKITLPTLFALNTLPSGERKLLERKITDRIITPEDIDELAHFMRTKSIPEQVRAIAQDFADQALADLRKIETDYPVSNEAIPLLEALVYFVVQRRI